MMSVRSVGGHKTKKEEEEEEEEDSLLKKGKARNDENWVGWRRSGERRKYKMCFLLDPV